MEKLIAANWKMNPVTREEATKLLRQVEKVKTNRKVVICPPFIHLSVLSPRFTSRTSSLKLGAQDVFWENPAGPYTGEISAAMLKSYNAEYVIIGHSERRRFLNESDEMISKKVAAAAAAGLKPILCVGEPISVRKRGIAVSKKFVLNQLKKDLKEIRNLKSAARNLIIAYEPIWAISTFGAGQVDSPDDSSEVISAIKKFFLGAGGIANVSVLYGGSVNGKNAAGFINHPVIDGALIGAASLKKDFFDIIRT